MDHPTFATDQLLALGRTWTTMFSMDFGRYLVAATLLSLIFLLVPYRVAVFQRMRRTLPRPGQRWYEFRHSVVATAIFGVVGVVVFYGSRVGLLHIEKPNVERGWLSWAFSLAVIVLAHDTYFYWTHRWMHHPTLFRRMHRTHHRSVASTVWTAYSFSIPEAVVQGAFAPLFLLVVPTPVTVMLVWGIHQILRNAAGHSGVELVPKSWLATWWGRWLTTTLHHDMHHQEGRGNYGLYFTWWDRWGGTENPEYRARLATLVRALGEKPSDTTTSATPIPTTHPTRSSPQSLPQTPP